MNATKIYRLGNWAFRKKIPLIPFVCKALIRLVFNCAIDPSTDIGNGSYFAYGGIAVVIHSRCRIGDDVVISQCVTLGGRSKSAEVPIIGSRVYIGAGAKILGNIKIGDDSVIGANAVVIKDVPQNSVVAGVPAKIIKTGIDPHDFY